VKGFPGKAGPAGPPGPDVVAYPGQFAQGATGPAGQGAPGAVGATGGHGDPTTCFEIFQDTPNSNFDYNLKNPPQTLAAAGSDVKATCPTGTTAVGGGRNCLTNGWGKSYAFPFGSSLDAVKPNYVDAAGWQGNCGAGPVRVYAICCPYGVTPSTPSRYGY